MASKADQLRARATRSANRKAAETPAPEHPQHPDQTSLIAAEPAAESTPSPHPAPAPQRPARGRSAPRTKPVRITVDLAPLAYRSLNHWCQSTADELEVAKVNAAAVVRSLLGILDEDPALAEQVRARIAADPSGYGTQ